MSNIKQFFISVCLCVVLLTAGSCTNENEIADNNNSLVTLTVRAAIGNFKAQQSPFSSTRTPTENGSKTEFSDGDAVGIFAVKNDAIVDNIENTKLIYNTTSNSWEPEDANAILYYYEGVKYIAYYPYKSGISITPTQTTAEIVSSLAANPALQPTADQSATDGSSYTGSDLMTASGEVVATSNPVKRELSLHFEHQFVLLVVKPMAGTKYIAPVGADYICHPEAIAYVTDQDAEGLRVNGVTARKMSDGSFRAIVKSTTGGTPSMQGSYVEGTGKTINFESNISTTGLEAGKYYTLQVNYVNATQEHALEIYDYYYSDGSIWPGGITDSDAPAPKVDGCAGVIFRIGIPTSQGDPFLSTDYPACTHGLVVGLKNSNNMRWMINSSVSCNPWTNDTDSCTISPVDIRNTGNYQGYANTKVLKAYNVDHVSKVPNSKVQAVSYLDDTPYNAIICPNSSGWYVPSIAELKYMYWGDGASSGTGGKDKLNTQMNKLNQALSNTADNVGSGTVWSSSESGASYDVAVMHNNGTSENRNKNHASNNYQTRPILAF